MSKRRKKSATAELPLLKIMERAQAMAEKPSTRGSANIADALRIALSEAIKACPLSPHQVAGEMSHLLNEHITGDMLYSWTAESKAQHQIWGSRLGAFCRVTGSRRPIEIIAESAGLFTLPGPEAMRAEIKRFAEQEKAARAERRKRELYLQDMEEGE